MESVFVPVALVGQGISFVVFGTVLFSVVMSILFLVTRGKDSMYDQIGAGGISRESDYAGTGAGSPGDQEGSHEEQQREIRQMLEARSDRRVARGEEPLDVDAEMARLLADAAGERERDPALMAEVRQLVAARNERRLRQGLGELDVEAEVARTLAELDP